MTVSSSYSVSLVRKRVACEENSLGLKIFALQIQQTKVWLDYEKVVRQESE